MANIIATPSIITLNPIPTLDGKGEIVWYDDFETGPPSPIVETFVTDPFGSKWEWQGSMDVGSRIALSSAWSKSGMFSLKLQTGNTATNFLVIGRYFPFIQSRRLGFEFTLLIPPTFPFKIHRLTLTVTTDVDGHSGRAGIGIDEINHQVFIIDSQGNDLKLATYAWEQPFKFVIDQVEMRYVKAIFGTKTLPLSEGMFVTPGPPLMVSSTVGLMRIDFYLETGIDASAIAYIDDFIITRREV